MEEAAPVTPIRVSKRYLERPGGTSGPWAPRPRDSHPTQWLLTKPLRRSRNTGSTQNPLCSAEAARPGHQKHELGKVLSQKILEGRIQKFWSLTTWIGVKTKPQREPSSSSANRKDERRGRTIQLTFHSPNLESVGKNSPPTGRIASHMTTQPSSHGTLGYPPINIYVYFYNYLIYLKHFHIAIILFR